MNFFYRFLCLLAYVFCFLNISLVSVDNNLPQLLASLDIQLGILSQKLGPTITKPIVIITPIEALKIGNIERVMKAVNFDQPELSKWETIKVYWKKIETLSESDFKDLVKKGNIDLTNFPGFQTFEKLKKLIRDNMPSEEEEEGLWEEGEQEVEKPEFTYSQQWKALKNEAIFDPKKSIVGLPQFIVGFKKLGEAKEILAKLEDRLSESEKKTERNWYNTQFKRVYDVVKGNNLFSVKDLKYITEHQKTEITLGIQVLEEFSKVVDRNDTAAMTWYKEQLAKFKQWNEQINKGAEPGKIEKEKKEAPKRMPKKGYTLKPTEYNKLPDGTKIYYSENGKPKDIIKSGNLQTAELENVEKIETPEPGIQIFDFKKEPLPAQIAFEMYIRTQK